MWLSRVPKPNAWKTTMTGMNKLPKPNAMLWANPNSENALFRLFAPTFSASNAPVDAIEAPSEMPSKMAAAKRTCGLVVKANAASVVLAMMLPAISIFFLPYLSAAIPRGTLAANVETPMIVITIPMVASESPCTLVRK